MSKIINSKRSGPMAQGPSLRGPHAKGVQFYCSQSTEPSNSIIFTLFYCLTIEQFLMKFYLGCSNICIKNCPLSGFESNNNCSLSRFLGNINCSLSQFLGNINCSPLGYCTSGNVAWSKFLSFWWIKTNSKIYILLDCLLAPKST